MRTLDALLVELIEGLPEPAGDERLLVRVDSVDLTVPVEARLVEGAVLRLGPVRTRLVTGFDAPVATISARIRRTG